MPLKKLVFDSDAPANLPDASWWVCPPEEFSARLQRRQAAMANSKFGRMPMLYTAANVREDEGRFRKQWRDEDI